MVSVDPNEKASVSWDEPYMQNATWDKKIIDEVRKDMPISNKMAKGGVLSDVDMYVKIHGHYPEEVMALRGDGMGLGIVKNEAHKFELSSEDSRKAEEMGYEFDYYDAKGWVEKEDDDDDFAKGGGVGRIVMIPTYVVKEIADSVKMGFDSLVEGMIGRTRKGVMLINKDYEVRGTYDIGLKDEIQKIIDQVKAGTFKIDAIDSKYAKGGETKFINLKTLKGQSEVEKYLQKGWSVKYQGDKFAILQKGGKKMVKGGATFDDKVKAISKNLKGRKVPKKLQKDYGKTYDTKQERDDAARRIAGAMRAEEMGTRKK
jgi:hypothetical protein